MFDVNFERDDKTTMNNSIELREPYQEKKTIETSINIPIEYMLKSDEDFIKKHISRDVIFELGIPNI